MRRLIYVFLYILMISFSLPIFAQSSGIEVQSNKEGVNVYIDNVFKGTTAKNNISSKILYKVNLSPGNYTIRCSKPGYGDIVEQVTVGDLTLPFQANYSETKTKVESISSTGGTAVAKTGVLKIISDPTGASIEVNGERFSTPTDCKLTTSVGRKKVKVSFPSFSLESEYFELSADSEVTIQADFNNKNITILNSGGGAEIPTTIREYTWVRDQPNLTGNVIAQLPAGTPISLLGRSRQKMKIRDWDSYWYKVKLQDGGTAFIYGYFINVDEQKFLNSAMQYFD